MYALAHCDALKRRDNNVLAFSPTARAIEAYTPRGRLLLQDRKPPWEHLTPKQLVISACQAVVVTAAPAFIAATPQYDPDGDDDDDLLDWDRLSSELEGFREKCTLTFARYIACTTLKRRLEAWCVSRLDPRTADRLLKDVALSAKRKALRHGRMGAARRMCLTEMRSKALGYGANLIVEELCLCYVYLRDRRRDKDALVKLQRASSTALLGFAASFSLSCLGSGLGTLAKPGWGTVVGGAAGDLAGLFVF